MTKCKDCDKQATYGLADKIKLYCSSHKKDNMINLKKRIHPKCIENG